MKALSLQSSTEKISQLTKLLLVLYLLANYLPLIFQAGISVDDWGDIAHNLDCSSFWHCYGSWFPLFSNRPLAPLPITVLTFSFGTWFTGYLIINSLLYLGAIALCAKVLRHISNQVSSMVFLLLASIPIIAMPVITSPINQSTATVSFLMWALSLWTLLRYLKFQSKFDWVITYLLLLAAFLTYEIILPLLVLTICLPWVFNAKTHRPWTIKYLMQFVMPIIGILAVVTLWQKGIAPHYMEVDSRLKFTTNEAIAKLHTFLDVFYRQLPALFMKMPVFIKAPSFFIVALGIAAYFLSQIQHPGKEGNPILSAGRHQRLLFVSLVCFLFCSSIFILSNESAIIGGYQARGLSSTWIGLTLLLASIYFSNPIFRRIWQLGMTVFISLCILCFSIERNQTITAWRLQMSIIENAQALLRKQNVPPGSTLMADVPHYLEPNFNDEIVFSQPWDFGAAIALVTQNQIEAGPVIDSSRKELRQLRLEKNVVLAQNFSGASLEQFWLYQYNAKESQGTLEKISNPNQFEALLFDLANPNQ